MHTLIRTSSLLIGFGCLLAAPMATHAAAGQPYASYWYPNTLLAWNPATDPDAPFNRANTPLATTFLNPALNVNPHARAGEARVTSLVAFAPTSGNPSQGGLSMSYYVLNYWQYIDVLVFWGGSAGEGLILAPNPTVVDAAHRNGVAVLGNVFLPPTAYGGNLQWVRDLVQRSGTHFPVADKLILAAQQYGFDGWFINQETAGGDTALATDMHNFLVYLQTNSSLRVMWYDAMTESGTINWQNALTTANDGFFQDSARVADDLFLNFWWSASGLASSRSRAQSLGRSPYDLYAGVDVEANGYNTTVGWASLFPEGQPHVLSLGFYRPEWTRNSSSSVTDFYARDNRFWIGPNGDPSNTASAEAWKGVAHYVPARSPINRLPFATSFNTGHGSRYAIDGQVVRNGEWNNLSLQDVLPTWRWLMRSTGEKLVPDWSWSDPYHGGTSLKVTGNLTATNDLWLYQTSLPVATNTHLRLAYKTGTSGTATCLKAAFAFEDAPTTFQFRDVSPTTSAGWNLQTFDLGAFAGRRIAVLGLRFAAPQAVSNYVLRIGHIAVFNGDVASPSPPTGLNVERVWLVNASTASARLRWTHSPATVYAYHIYRRNPDGSRTWLGATPNNAYFAPEIVRAGSESSTPLEVEAVGWDFGASTPARAEILWPATLVGAGAVWNYCDTGTNLGTAWRSAGFDDSGWPSGPAMLGYGDADGLYPRTTNRFGPSDANKYITTYYRHGFQVDNPAAYSSLTLNLQRDDGAIVYLNGAEVFRSNMPTGTVDYLTRASSAVSGSDESAWLSTAVDPKTTLAGSNVLAVEIHQNAPTSSDLAFDLSLVAEPNLAPTATITRPADGTVLTTNAVLMAATAADLDGTIAQVEFFANGAWLARRTASPYLFAWTNIPVGFHLLTVRAVDNHGQAATSAPVSVTSPGVGSAVIPLVSAGALWRYFDQTNDPGSAWRSHSFNDASWSSGPTELGFGDAIDGRPEAQVIQNNGQWTSYFRHTFQVPAATLVRCLNARLIRDDGAVVYLNGAEVWRNNLPAGSMTYTTPATAIIGGTDESTWLTNTLPRSALRDGTNLLAVEIHQQSTTSSDVSFNFELSAEVLIPSEPLLTVTRMGNDVILRWPADPGVFQVFTTTNLSNPIWTRQEIIPVLTPAGWTAILPAPADQTRFLRLQTP